MDDPDEEEDDLDFVTLTKKEADWILNYLSPLMIPCKEVRDVMRFISGKFRMREDKSLPPTP